MVGFRAALRKLDPMLILRLIIYIYVTISSLVIWFTIYDMQLCIYPGLPNNCPHLYPADILKFPTT